MSNRFNNYYLFTDFHRKKLSRNVPKISCNKDNNFSFNTDKIYKYMDINININSKDKLSNENLLNEINILREKINKYKNELKIAKRENNAQNKYINLLEQKYISQLLLNKENINYSKIKDDIKSNRKGFMSQFKNENNNNKGKLENKNSPNINNFNYKEFKEKMFYSKNKIIS